jgi:tape measure domain-containing protein
VATDVERLVVLLEAKMSQYERSLARASGLAKSRAKEIESSFTRLNKNMSGMGFAGLSRGLGAIAAVVGIEKIIGYADAWTQAQNSLRVAGVEASNLAPIMEKLFGIAQNTGTALDPLVTLYSRAAQVSRELGASQEELLTFTTGVANALKVAGTDSQAASGALLQLSQALGGAKVQAEEFNSINDGARPILQAVANGMEEAGGSVAKLKSLVNDGLVSNKAFFQAFLAGSADLQTQAEQSSSTVGQALTRMNNAFTKLVGEVDASSGASKGLAGEIDNLAQAFEDLTPYIQEVIGWISALRETTDAAFDGLVSLGAQARSAIDPAGYAANRIGNAFGIVDPLNTSTPKTLDQLRQPTRPPLEIEIRPKKRVSLKDFPVVGDSGRGGGGGGGGGSKEKTESDYERELKSIERRTAALRVEAQAVGMSAAEAERRQAQLDLENSVTDAGLELTDERRRKIEEVSAAYGAQIEVLAQLQAQQEQVDAFAADAYDAFKSGFKDAITGAKSLDEALKGIGERLLDLALDSTLDALFKPAQGGGGGGLFGGIFSALGGLFGGGRANGGPVRAGRVYRVGETGPETFIPSVNGRITPAEATKAQTGTGSVTQHTWQIDARGADASAVTRLEAWAQSMENTFDRRVLSAGRTNRLRSSRA